LDVSTGNSGYGYGYGYGYGSGYGDGDGYGYGDGYGDGSGSGSGYGDGSGYGSGYGDGDGDGSGSGSGYETKVYLDSFLTGADVEEGCTAVFWRSDADGKPCNGGSGPAVTVGMVQEIAGPLQVCTKQALHGTRSPGEWKGERWWLVALYPPIQEQEDKLGSLKRKILADLGKCPF
jgi:hypothetical protein